MIEANVYRYLIADSTLYTLLGASGSDSKIYLEVPLKEPTAPYILYSSEWGTLDSEVLSEDRVHLSVASDDPAEAKNIRARLLTLLDKQDLIQDTTLFTGSTDYWIYWSKLTGYDSHFLPERQFYLEELYFSIRYQLKN
jgi:hypothetical protein